MAAKKLFTQIFIYFSKPLRLLYSLIIYEIVNFSFFTLYSLLLLSFFLYLKCSYIRDCSCTYVCTLLKRSVCVCFMHHFLISYRRPAEHVCTMYYYNIMCELTVFLYCVFTQKTLAQHVHL